MDHFYIDRRSGKSLKESFFCDPVVNFMYNPVFEKFSFIQKALLSSYSSEIAAYFNYESFLSKDGKRLFSMIESMGIDMDEVYEIEEPLTALALFERKIKYWEKRPLSEASGDIASPCDSRMLTGSDSESSLFFIKDKFFSYEEILSSDRKWKGIFKKGDFAIFRLTPDKYHYNHLPVSGKVVDFYEIKGLYHSCNPCSSRMIEAPYSKNKRVVTIIDTDVENGTGVGFVAMVEVVALMIGRIIQCYSEKKYHGKAGMKKGLFLKKGQPKSRFAPGSSTTILLFEKERIRFDEDILLNQKRADLQSGFSMNFSTPLIETDVKVRETIGKRI